jgi:hypothetical protein
MATRTPRFTSKKIFIRSGSGRKNKKSSLTKKRQDINKKLKEVYTDGSGKVPDMSRLDKTNRSLWKTTIYALIAFVFVLLVVTAFGFYIFGGVDNDSFTNEKITLTIEAPITLISGQDTVYTILLTNKEKVNLYNAELELFYPDNFEYVESEPVASGEKDNQWSFNILRTGETQKIELSGKMVAALNSVQTFRGVLSFKPSGFNAVYKQETIIDVAVGSSVVTLDISGPDKSLANAVLEYVIDYSNFGEENLIDLQTILEYPEGCVLESAEPETDDGANNLWSMDSLAAGEEGQIKISIDCSAIASGGNYELNAQVLLNRDGDYYPQDKEVHVINIIRDQLSLGLIINGSAEDQAIDFGELLVYSINYKNTGQEDLENIEIVANLDSQIVDWQTLSDDTNGKWQGNTITWTGREIPQLLKLGPDEDGQISWTVRAKDVSVIGDSDIDKFNVESYIEATADQSGEIDGQSTVESKTIISSINSDLGLIAEVMYYNEYNIPLGLGPIEPQVGQESSYSVRLKLANNLHDINDLLITTTLPENIGWANREQHTVGDVIYNSQSNKITWSVNKLPKAIDGAELSFNVTVKPTEADLGRVLALVASIQLSAKDGETGADITKTQTALTTSFVDPILGRTTGIVN